MASQFALDMLQLRFSQSFLNLDIGTYLHEDIEMDIGRIVRQCIHLDIILCEEFT